MPTKPTFLDLFCGCGGFSLGLERAGFRGLAAIDFNREAVHVFRANFPRIPHILEKDLTQFSPPELESLIGTRHFLKIKDGESSVEAMRRNVEIDFPYDKTTFKDRYTRQHRHRPCSPIVAHLAKDGLMFIRPTQNPQLFLRMRQLQLKLERDGLGGLAA